MIEPLTMHFLLRVVFTGSLIFTGAEELRGASGDETKPGAVSSAGIQEIDFRRDVAPILRMRCVKCHGVEKQEGGLRLDQRGGILKSARDPAPEKCAIFQRITTTDIAVRMPQGEEALSALEIETIRKWILAGIKVPEEFVIPVKEAAAPSLLDRVASFDRWLEEKPYRRVGLVLLPLIVGWSLAAILLRRRLRRGGSVSKVEQFLLRLTPERMVMMWMLGGLGLWLMQTKYEAGELTRRLSLLEGELQTTKTSYGPGSSGSRAESTSVLKPFRLSHPKGLSRTYYRGNCERHPGLFNNGNYLTAMLRVSLRTKSGRQLEYGEPIPDEELVLHFELERGPRTSESFFKPERIQTLLLAIQDAQGKRQEWTMRTVKEDWLWDCEIPVKGEKEPGERWEGEIRVEDGAVKGGEGGNRHYQLFYDLRGDRGKISSESDVWVACIFTVPRVQEPAPEGKLPFNEWFDWRPLPEITGENSTDPKLLGLPPEGTAGQGNTAGSAEKNGEKNSAQP